MTQSFDGVVLDGEGSIVNFQVRPPDVLDTTTSVVNSNARTSGILVVDGTRSANFTGSYLITKGVVAGSQAAEYALIKAKETVVGTLVNDTQTVSNVALLSVSKPQHLGNGQLRCTLNFELLNV